MAQKKQKEVKEVKWSKSAEIDTDIPIPVESKYNISIFNPVGKVETFKGVEYNTMIGGIAIQDKGIEIIIIPYIAISRIEIKKVV